MATLLVFVLSGVLLLGMMRLKLPLLVPDHTNIWSDGSLVLDQVTGVSSSGAGFFLHVRLMIAGVIGGGVMLTVFGRLMLTGAVGGSVLFCSWTSSVCSEG